MKKFSLPLALSSLLLFSLSACSGSSGSGSAGGSGGSGGGTTPFSISGTASSVLLGKTVQFTANQSVSSWTVNSVTGGNSTVGTISSTGLYTAPAVLPSSTAITIGATTASSYSATAALTITSDVAISLSASSSANPILTQSTVNLSATITSAGAPSTAITWTVNGIVNGSNSIGTITPGANGTAVYTAPNGISPTSIQIVATSVADTTKTSSLSRTVQPIVFSASSAMPGSVITATGTFCSQPVLFNLSDNLSYSFSVSVTPTTSTTLSFTVPMYVNASQQIAQGAVLISAAQHSTLVAGGSLPIADNIPFTIGALPAAPGNPGDVTNAVLSALSSLASDVQYNFDQFAQASKGAVQSTVIDNATADQLSHLNSAMTSISTLASGGSAISIGTSTYGNLQLTSANLPLLDSILQAYIVNDPDLQAMFQSLPVQQRAMLGLPHAQPNSVLTASSLAGVVTQTLADQVQDFNGFIIKITTVATFAGIVAGAPALALFGATVLGLDILANAAGTVGLQAIINQLPTQQTDGPIYTSSLNIPSLISSAQADDGATQNNDFNSSNSDSETEIGNMNPGSTSSLWSTITNAWSTITNNLPPHPTSTSTPVFSVASTYGPAGGPIEVNLVLTNAPAGAEYIATGSWTGGTPSAPIFADAYGHDTATLGIPASAIGSSSCYSGTITFTNYSSGGTVNTISGCWGTPAGPSADVMLFFDTTMLITFYQYAEPIESTISVTANGYPVASLNMNGVSNQSPLFQICNVPIGTVFTLAYSFTNIPTGQSAITGGYVINASDAPGYPFPTETHGGPSYLYIEDPTGEDEAGLPSWTFNVAASCPASGCASAASVMQYYNLTSTNSCVSVPGLTN